jgi:Fibronectin type III domain
MPTISQLPTATVVTAADLLPVSQSGSLCSAALGTILENTQPAIEVDSQTLIGRTSLGSGGPEQVNVGAGLTIEATALSATGLDHNNFPLIGSFDLSANLVAASAGTPILVPIEQLRDLFSAGSNIAINSSGVISATGTITGGVDVDIATQIATLQTASNLSAGALIPVSQAGTGCVTTYANLIDGVTIDQAQTASATGDSDTIWVAQSSSTLTRQNFGAIWSWIANKIPSYEIPTIELTASATLQSSLHAGRILICSEPLTLSLPTGLPNGFCCTVINASGGSVTFGTGFLTSSGASTLGPWQAATISNVVYSGGTVAFVNLGVQSSSSVEPGSVTGLSMTTSTSSSITVSWQAPAITSGSITYAVQYRISGTSTWNTANSSGTSTSYQISGLSASTSYDITVQVASSGVLGAYSSILTVSTAGSSQTSIPSQVSGLSAEAVSSTSITLTWTTQSGSSAASTYTVQYRITGESTWMWSVTGITGSTTSITGLQANTSYDFSVFGVNSSGSGAISIVVSTETPTVQNSVTSIIWNVPPNGPYAKGNGAIGVNAHVNPGTSVIQFGISASSTVPPTTWAVATYVNTDLWGAYIGTPSAAGNYYIWAEGTDGSAVTVYSTPFVVQ